MNAELISALRGCDEKDRVVTNEVLVSKLKIVQTRLMECISVGRPKCNSILIALAITDDDTIGALLSPGEYFQIINIITNASDRLNKIKDSQSTSLGYKLFYIMNNT